MINLTRTERHNRALDSLGSSLRLLCLISCALMVSIVSSFKSILVSEVEQESSFELEEIHSFKVLKLIKAARTSRFKIVQDCSTQF